ncbi:hypothetical protein FQT10_13435 [Enterococcus mundtii]|nr:hypothetical protein [Enterococcus mundtii]
MTKIERQIRGGLPQVGTAPYGQVHAHSTANKESTAQNEADYMGHKDINGGFYTHVVGNGRIIQVAEKNRGAWDVGGGWNSWCYAAVELIESHKNKEEFLRDYAIYVNLLRDLAAEAGIPKKLDRGSVGINTHDYCRRNQPYNQTNHVDPYPYLATWGISAAQFQKDVENGISVAPSKPATKPQEQPKPKPNEAKTVTIAKHASQYSKSSKSAKIADFIKGKSWKVLQERAITQSHSNREYLIAGTDGKTPVGWILSQDVVGGYGNDKVGKPAAKPQPKPQPKPAGVQWIAEKGKFYPNQSLPLTVDASGKGSLIANIGKGSYVEYNAFAHTNGYVWIRQPRAGGKYGYMATGRSANGKRQDVWGTFK